VSPLLANIYLHELDRYMESNYLNIPDKERKRRRYSGQGNYLYVRYADDFVVLCNGTKGDAQRMTEELGGLLNTMGLNLSKEKTKTTHITEGFTFLGYRMERTIGTRGKMAPRVTVPNDAIKRFQAKTREILAPRTSHESVKAKIIALNQLTRGWCQYYSITSSPSIAFKKVQYELFWGMAHWLSGLPKVLSQLQ
jgi:RNA-directed DNA polymerase